MMNCTVKINAMIKVNHHQRKWVRNHHFIDSSFSLNEDADQKSLETRNIYVAIVDCVNADEALKRKNLRHADIHSRICIKKLFTK